jgi:hypothetical protein
VIRNLVIAASCLFVIVSAASGASAQLLPAPAHAVCLASAPPASAPSVLFAPKGEVTCGQKCFASEGGTTATLDGFGSTCAETLSNLTAELDSEANTACQNFSGFRACSVVIHITVGCVPDGDPQYLIEEGYATYSCIDTTC